MKNRLKKSVVSNNESSIQDTTSATKLQNNNEELVTRFANEIANKLGIFNYL